MAEVEREAALLAAAGPEADRAAGARAPPPRRGASARPAARAVALAARR